MSIARAEEAGPHLELRAMADNSWRLCDRDVSPNDAASVVAYVEATARGYEVVWVLGPQGRTWVPTLERVAETAAHRLAAFGTGGGRDDRT